MKKLLITVLEQLSHASSVKGLVGIFGSLGLLSLSPNLEGQIVAVIIAVVGLIQLFVDEKDKDNTAIVKEIVGE